jgi:hypothetical protein
LGFTEARGLMGPGFRPYWHFDIINLAPVDQASLWGLLPIFSYVGDDLPELLQRATA